MGTVPGRWLERQRGQHRPGALLALDEGDVEASAREMVSAFRGRHRVLAETLSAHFDFAAPHVAHPETLTDARRTLLGATFTHEYSTEPVSRSTSLRRF